MTPLRLISVLTLFLLSTSAAFPQIRLVPREKVESVANPRLSRDSAALAFDTGHIVAEPMTEDDRPQTFVYRFTNVGDRTLEIKRLVSTCSCASAVALNRSVAPGEASEIRVTYYPKGHPGRFERKVFVYTEAEDAPAAVLRLSVDVDNGKDLSADWPVQMGPIRLRRAEITFSEGVKAVERMRFINLSGKSLELTCEEAFLPGCISFRTEPAVVGDGQEGELLIAYDPSAGASRDLVKIILKGLGLPPSKASLQVRIIKE